METLKFKWTVSRDRDSYGYNICSLWINGKKVSSCNGGGYDMKGTALGNWMERKFREELLNLEIPWTIRNGEKVQEYWGLTFHDPDYDPGKTIIDGETVAEREEKGKSIGLERYQSFYRASSRLPSRTYRIPQLDGACGFSSMELVLNAIGHQLQYVNEAKNHDVYVLTKREGYP